MLKVNSILQYWRCPFLININIFLSFEQMKEKSKQKNSAAWIRVKLLIMSIAILVLFISQARKFERRNNGICFNANVIHGGNFYFYEAVDHDSKTQQKN